MNSDQTFEFNEQSEAGIEQRRGLISRLLGKSAVAEQSEFGGINFLSNFESTYQKEIEQFDDAWRQNENAIEDFISNQENIQMLRDTILEYRHAHDEGEIYHESGRQINSRRFANKMSERDIEDFVGAHVLRARHRAQFGDSYRQFAKEITKNTENLAEAKSILRQEGLAIDTADLRWQEVKDTACEHMPNATEFYRRVEELGLSLDSNYATAFKSAGRIMESLFKRLTDDRGEIEIHKAVQLIDFIEDEDVLADADSTFIKLLASQHKQYGSRSILGECLNRLEESIESGSLLGEFLENNAEHNDGNNYLQLIRRIISDLNPDVDEAFYLQSISEHWPTKMERDYLSFAKSRFNRHKALIDQFANRFSDKRLIQIDGDTVAISMERILSRTMGKLLNPHKGKALISPSEAIKQPIAPEKKTKKGLPVFALSIGARTRKGQEFEFTNGDKLDRMKQAILNKYPHERNRLEEDIENTINALGLKPFDRRGSMPVASNKPVVIGGKRYNIYRFNPAQHPGLSLGEQGKQIRVVYTVAEDKLGILELLADHDEYERALQKYT